MERKWSYRQRRWLALTVLALSATSGIGLCRLAPVGKDIGVIQFDAVNELGNNSIGWDRGFYEPDTIWFARYWVCRDYFAVSVVWTEPRGKGTSNVKTLAILSDKDGFRMNEDQFPFWVPGNMTYPKPSGERGPFKWRGGFYGIEEMRFAEAEAMSRRVYMRDLEPLKARAGNAENTIDLKPDDSADGVKRNVTQLKVQMKTGRIASLDVLGHAQQKLVGVRYEYDDTGRAPGISRLIADLPVKPEKLALDVNGTVTIKDQKIPYRISSVDHVYHVGGRTCTVTYRDVTTGGATLRLPVRVEVRRTDDKRLVRSATLMNFKRVDLDKTAVWEAAKAYGGFSGADRQVKEIVEKFLEHMPTLGPLNVDPNDLTSVRRLIAKYPVPEYLAEPEPGSNAQTIMKERAEQIKRIDSTPKPKRMTVEPNDARQIRQWHRYYSDKTDPTTDEEREKMRMGILRGTPVRTTLPEDQWELRQLRDRLGRIRSYHRFPILPEDRAPEPNDLDLKLIRRLHGHYEPLVVSTNRTLGERLKALDALWRLDVVAKDYDALDRSAVLYLQMLHDANLPAMYLVGGYDGHISSLIEAGQFDRAKKLLRQWRERATLDNDADTVYRFCGWNRGGKGDPWVGVQLLDQFLKKPGLSPLERYEGLALRAISLDNLDKLLAIPQEDLDTKGSKIGLVRWVLSGTTRAEIARQAEAAVREAASAWQSLGAAKDNEAKPYSTFELDNWTRERLGASADATRLQETSAQLNKIVQQRLGKRSTVPRSRGETIRPGGTRR